METSLRVRELSSYKKRRNFNMKVLFLVLFYSLTSVFSFGFLTSPFYDVKSNVKKDIFSQSLFNKMKGEWKIEYNIRRSRYSRFQKGQGKAKFEKHFGEGQIKETFELGGRFRGEAFINFATAHKRFELFQIDMMSSRRSTIYLIGKYSEDEKRLKFYNMKDHPQWGRTPALEIKWEYVFYEDGSFKKEMYMKDDDGNFYLQSDYHYKKQ